ncbi:hypothetical protein RASY3_03995 [Ruminococcus albus SY3]|uniref:Uncharacterized protein n=1 Tax=Ruminococcus albus SY3 TaxID=1341156 RepID=A0A011V6D2_RUMAL|nr:hypothetical protein RASY3_03995 [Ruminococcus albus SY3]
MAAFRVKKLKRFYRNNTQEQQEKIMRTLLTYIRILKSDYTFTNHLKFGSTRIYYAEVLFLHRRRWERENCQTLIIFF